MENFFLQNQKKTQLKKFKRKDFKIKIKYFSLSQKKKL